jgi:hypothetical protein
MSAKFVLLAKSSELRGCGQDNDTGIYILKTISKSEWMDAYYRIAEVKDIKFEFYEKEQPYNLGSYMQEMWGGSEYYGNKDVAFYHAKQLARGPWNNSGLYSYQHGILLIETDYIFYGDI